MTKRDTWRLDLAKQAIRTAEKHLEAGRREHFHRSIAFAREMLASWDDAVAMDEQVAQSIAPYPMGTLRRNLMTQEQADGAVAKALLHPMAEQGDGKAIQRGIGGQG